jgi:hypothetical protein
MKKKLSIIIAGLAVIIGLEASGIQTSYIDEVQQYLKVVISVFLASDSTSDILKGIRALTEIKNGINSK